MLQLCITCVRFVYYIEYCITSKKKHEPTYYYYLPTTIIQQQQVNKRSQLFTKEASFAEKYPLPASPTCQLFGYNLSCLKHRRTKKNSWNCHVIVRAMGELMYCTAAVWQDFPRKFPRKVTVMYWRHLCEFKTLPTCIWFLSVLWKNILCLDQEEKWKRKKSSQNKYQFLFFLDITIMKENINSLYPKPELLLPYLCLSFKKQLSYNYKDRRKLFLWKN